MLTLLSSVLVSSHQWPLREGRVGYHGEVFLSDKHEQRQESAAEVVEVVSVVRVTFHLFTMFGLLVAVVIYHRRHRKRCHAD